MGYPNQLVPTPDGWHRYPLMRIVHKTGDQLTGVFVDDMHDSENWHEWEPYPPSWMDPQVFVKMALESEEVKKAVATVCANDLKKLPAVTKILHTVFIEQYIKYIADKFDKAAPYISEWLVANAVDKQDAAEWKAECTKQDKINSKVRKAINEPASP